MAQNPLDLARKYGKGKPVSKAHGGGLAYRVPAKAGGGGFSLGNIFKGLSGQGPGPGASDAQKKMAQASTDLGKIADSGGGAPPPPQVPAANFSAPQMPNLFGGSRAGGPAPWDNVRTGLGGGPAPIDPGKGYAPGGVVDGAMPDAETLELANASNLTPEQIARIKLMTAWKKATGPGFAPGGMVGGGSSLLDGMGAQGYGAGGGADFTDMFNGSNPDLNNIVPGSEALGYTIRQGEQIHSPRDVGRFARPMGLGQDHPMPGIGMSPPMNVPRNDPNISKYPLPVRTFAPGGGIDSDYGEPELPPRQGMTEEEMLAAMLADKGGVPDYLKTQQREGIPGADGSGFAQGMIRTGKTVGELSGVPSVVRGTGRVADQLTREEGTDPWQVAGGAAEAVGGAMPLGGITKPGAQLIGRAMGTLPKFLGTNAVLGTPDIVNAAHAGQEKQGEIVKSQPVPAYLTEKLNALKAERSAAESELRKVNDQYKKAGPETQRQALEPLQKKITGIDSKITEAEGLILGEQQKAGAKVIENSDFYTRNPGWPEAFQKAGWAIAGGLPFVRALRTSAANRGTQSALEGLAKKADAKMGSDDVLGFAEDQAKLQKGVQRLEKNTSFLHNHVLPVAEGTVLGTVANLEARSLPDQLDWGAFPSDHPTAQKAYNSLTSANYYKERVPPAAVQSFGLTLGGHELGKLISPKARVTENMSTVAERGTPASLERIKTAGDYLRAAKDAKAVSQQLHSDKPILEGRALSAEEASATALPANAPLGQRPALGAPLGAQRSIEQPPADIPQPAPTASLGAPRPSDPTSTPPLGTPPRTEATSPPPGSGLGQTASPGTTPGTKGPGSGEQSTLPPPLGAKSAAEPPGPTPAPAPSRGIDTSAESPFGGAPLGSTRPGSTDQPAAGPGTSNRPSSSPVPPAQGLPDGHRWVFNPRTGVYQVHNAQGDFVPTPKDIAAPATKKQSKAGTSKRASKKSDPSETRRDGGAILTARKYGGRIGGFIRKAFGGGTTGGAPDHGPAKVGPIVGETGGREDALPISVPSGSYVIPADCVAALGGGNTLAGMKTLQENFGKADPNDAVGPAVPIKISDGEFVISPEQVAKIGQGDVSKGHRVLDQLVRRIRAEHVKTLKGLPGPRQD